MLNTLLSTLDDKLNNLSVNAKLKSLVVSSIILAGIIIVIGIYGIFSVNSSMVTTYKQSVVPLDELRTAKTALGVDVIELLTQLKEGKVQDGKVQSVDEMYADAAKRIAEAKNSFIINWTNYKKGSLSDEEKGQLETLEPKIEKAITSIDNAQKILEKQDFMGLLEFVGSEMPFFISNVPPELDGLMQIQVAKTINLYEDSQTTFYIILCTVVALSIAGVAAVYWIARRIEENIVNAVDNLYMNADDLAHNKLATPFVWKRKDELGKLGRRLEYTRVALNNLIEDLQLSNENVSKAHEAIRHSINYARRIQMSFLPEDANFIGSTKSNDMTALIKDYFVVWNPKDIIGGDCYWFEHTEDGFFIAVIDCTGHGVPGALMTFVVLSALAKSLVDKTLAQNPAELLALMNRHIKNDLGQHTDNGASNDGMDGAFIFINKDHTKLTYAGANTPLMFIRPNSQEFEELRPDKLSAGYVHVPSDAKYSNQELELEAGMKFYITTDGIVDQVGGDKNLCFGKKRLKKILMQTRNLSMEEQKKQLLEEFYMYRGKQIQRDDNTIVGFEI